MAEKSLKQVRLSRENEERLVQFIESHPPPSTIQNVVNFAVEQFLDNHKTNNTKGTKHGNKTV